MTAFLPSLLVAPAVDHPIPSHHPPLWPVADLDDVLQI